MRDLSDVRFASERLRMRKQAPEDAAALFEAYGDEGLMTWWSSGPHADIAETRAYLRSRGPSAGWCGWVMATARDGRIVGSLAAHETRPGVCEIGYMVLRRDWGRGFAREGVGRLIDLLFAEGARRIYADTDPDNDASNGLLRRLGFMQEGRLRAEWETHIGVRDSLIWGLLKDEWRR
ncbi:GNAT family N-acetyltransferase [Sphingomonas sp. RS2018]